MLTWISICCLLLPAEAEISKLDGTSVKGDLVSLTPDGITVRNEQGEQIVSADDVLAVRWSGATAETSANIQQVITTDGATIAVSNASATADLITAKSVYGELEFDRQLVRALRLREQSSNRLPEWRAFLKRANDKDMLIIEKRDQSGLDFLAGVVSAVSEDSVTFLLNGNEIPVPRERVFGVVFTKQETEKIPGLLAVKTAAGEVINATAVELDEDLIIVDTSWGDVIDVPLSGLKEIDFSSSRLQYLSDLEPLSETYFGLNPPDKKWDAIFEEDESTRTGFSRPWKMSRDQFPNNGRPPLSLRGTTYRKGLCLFPRAEVEYALDGEYSRLQAAIGVDDEVALYKPNSADDTQVELTILLDGETVWQQKISASGKPILLDLDVSEASTLQLNVDFGDDSSERDYLDLADARLLLK